MYYAMNVILDTNFLLKRDPKHRTHAETGRRRRLRIRHRFHILALSSSVNSKSAVSPNDSAFSFS